MKLRSGKTSRLLCVKNAWCIHYSVACDAGYVGYTYRHLHQRIEARSKEDRQPETTSESSTIWLEPEDIAQSFRLEKVSEQI